MRNDKIEQMRQFWIWFVQNNLIYLWLLDPLAAAVWWLAASTSTPTRATNIEPLLEVCKGNLTRFHLLREGALQTLIQVTVP